jgi:dTDP-4-amino-4,6-dideoxygalactose transaminase
MFFIKVRDLNERSALIEHLNKCGIQTAFHYVPLHTSPYGEANTNFHGEDFHTTQQSERLLRLPMFYGLSIGEIHQVIQGIESFFCDA